MHDENSPVSSLHNLTGHHRHLTGLVALGSIMGSSKKKVHLVGLRHDMPKGSRQFHCGEKILESGIYRVVHRNHRLPHEVTLLRDQLFPKCSRCEGSVYFELVRSAPDITLTPFKVALYALPPTDDEEEGSIVA